MKSLLRITLSAMLILLLSSQELSAAVNLQPSPKLCIDRETEEKFVNCFETNLACHDALKRISADQTASWETIALAVAGGLVAGMVLAQQIRK